VVWAPSRSGTRGKISRSIGCGVTWRRIRKDDSRPGVWRWRITKRPLGRSHSVTSLPIRPGSVITTMRCLYELSARVRERKKVSSIMPSESSPIYHDDLKAIFASCKRCRRRHRVDNSCRLLTVRSGRQKHGAGDKNENGLIVGRGLTGRPRLGAVVIERQDDVCRICE